MKIKIQLFLLGLFMMLTGIAQAQDATVATGGEATGTGGSASFTVGQASYKVTSSTGHTETQGVQQPYEISVVTSLQNVEGICLFFSAYPNPTTHELNLKIEKYAASGLSFQLTDLNGKVLQQNAIDKPLTKMSLSNYVAATYFLSVTKNNQRIKSFKILKK